MEPAARGMADMGCAYRGVLYAGLILTADGPKALEFNCRLGDPEAQAILPRLKSDLAEVMMLTATGSQSRVNVEWSPESCVAVVLASGGYPGDYAKGYPIEGLSDLEDGVEVFYAGVKAIGDGTRLATDGGRVLTLASLDGSLEEARRRVYANAGRIRFQDAFYRTDIAASVQVQLPSSA